MTTAVKMRVVAPSRVATGTAITFAVTLIPDKGPQGTIIARFGTGLSRQEEQRREVRDGKMIGAPLTFTAKWIGFNRFTAVYVPPPRDKRYFTCTGGTVVSVLPQ